MIASDSFDDGNYDQNLVWTVVSGDFTPAYGELISRFTAPAAAQQNQQQNSDDLGSALFGALVQGLAQSQGQGTGAQAPATRAQIDLSTSIPNAFATVVTLRTPALTAGGFEFGTDRDLRGSGYRIVIGPGSVTLVRASATGSAIVERANLPANIANDQDHTFELTRDTSGELVVNVDGSELIRVRDMGIRDSFDRFMFINNGGEYRLQSVAIYGTP